MQVVERPLDRMPHPGLGGEVHDAVQVRLRVHQFEQRRPVGNITFLKLESRHAGNGVEPVALERRIVVVVDRVDTDHLLAPVEEGARDMHANEPGDTGQQYGHASLRGGSR